MSYVKRLFFLVTLIFLGCVKDTNFDKLKIDCSSGLEPNKTIEEIKALYKGSVIQIQEDIVIEGYVISSDKQGNFFGSIHFQDTHNNPKIGFQIDIDGTDSHLFYPSGSKIILKLKGLYLGKSKGVLKLGGVFSAFGNLSVGRLPALKVEKHVFLMCDSKIEIQPQLVTLKMIDDNRINTLIKLKEVEVIEADLNKPFAEEKEITKRKLQDCNGDRIVLLNSGYADFHQEAIPEGNGEIVGVLLKNKKEFQLVIRSLEDVTFSKQRCDEK